MTRKISHRLAGTYIVVIILIVALMAAAFYQYTYYKLYEEGTGNLNQLCESTMAQVDSRLKALEETAVTMAANWEFLDAMEQVAADPGGCPESARFLKEAAVDACVKRSELRRVSIFTESGFFCCSGVVDESASENFDAFLKEISQREENRKFFLSPHLDTWDNDTGVQVLSLVKPVKDRQARVVGYIELQENLQYLRKICDNRWNGNSLGTLILDEENRVFYKNLAESEKNSALISQALELSGTYAPHIKETPNAVLSIYNSNINYFKTVLILEKTDLYQTMNSVLLAVFIMAGLLLLLTCLFILFSTKVITRPINTLVERMEKTELQNMDASFENIKVKDYETEILIRTFERMTRRLKESITKQNALADAQTKTLFRALQSTISPHFLYNTLGSIANMCENGEGDAAANACYCLTDLLRYASDYTTCEVDVADEMQNLQDYFSIMKSRYRQRLEYDCHLQPQAGSCTVPKLTLQPLVENAIKYSLIEREQVKICVDARIEENCLLLKVSDNGTGISPEKREEIRREVKDYFAGIDSRDVTEPLRFGGMGLIGTLLRLMIYYKERFDYEIGKNEQGGTRIALKIRISGNGENADV